MRVATVVAATAAVLSGAGAASAQVVIDGSGVQTGGVVIDGRGIHTPGAEIDARGVRNHRGRGPGAGLTVTRNSEVSTLDCRGGAADILGNRNRLRLQNCSRLDVSGNRNELTVSLVAPAEVSVLGNGDTVRYRTPPSVRAHVSVVGSGARVSETR